MLHSLSCRFSIGEIEAGESQTRELRHVRCGACCAGLWWTWWSACAVVRSVGWKDTDEDGG